MVKVTFEPITLSLQHRIQIIEIYYKNDENSVKRFEKLNTENCGKFKLLGQLPVQ